MRGFQVNWLGIFLTFALFSQLVGINAFCQSRFEQDEIVTFTDCRWVYSVDYGPREVYFATNGGIWRLKRFSGESLDPWTWGKTLEGAFPLAGSAIVHWHDPTATLWLDVRGSLVVYHWGTNRWRVIKDANQINIQAIGSNQDSVLVDMGSGDRRYVVFDPVSLRLLGNSPKEPDDVRWSSRRSKNEFPHYFIDDFDLFYNPIEGSIEDWKHNKFKPTCDRLDERFKRRYICYPGLGIGIAEENRSRLRIIQPGPTGWDVQSVGFAPGGFIWIGGQDEVDRGGISLFDRKTGTWSSFDPSRIYGIDSHKVQDIAVFRNNAYFATDEGLVCFLAGKNQWKTLNRFDALYNVELTAVATGYDQIIIGGRNGLNHIIPPDGPVLWYEDERIAELRVHDIIADADTFWAAGFQGLYRYDPDNSFRLLIMDDPAVGNEAPECLALTGNALWVGSRGGLHMFSRLTGDWSGYPGYLRFNESEPLSIAANDTLVWVGTNDGLFAGNLVTDNWVRFGLVDGLLSEKIQSLTLEADTLWIGSPVGLTRFRWNRTDNYIY